MCIPGQILAKVLAYSANKVPQLRKFTFGSIVDLNHGSFANSNSNSNRIDLCSVPLQYCAYATIPSMHPPNFGPGRASDPDPDLDFAFRLRNFIEGPLLYTACIPGQVKVFA